MLSKKAKFLKIISGTVKEGTNFICNKHEIVGKMGYQTGKLYYEAQLEQILSKETQMNGSQEWKIK